MRAIFVAVALALAISPAQAWHHPVVAPVVKVVAHKAAPHASHGQRFLCVANPAGFFICAVTVAIVVHELSGPACASNTKRNRARGYDTPALWRPLCNWKDPQRVRSTKLWPQGK